MAFKMKRSMIKGTPAYKKAKVEAINVAKAPVGGSAELIKAAERLGKAKSLTPKIDYTVEPSGIDWSKIEFGKRGESKLGKKIGNFFINKYGQIKDATGKILKGTEKDKAEEKIVQTQQEDTRKKLTLKERLQIIKDSLTTKKDNSNKDDNTSKNKEVVDTKTVDSTEESIERTSDLGPRADKKDNQEQDRTDSDKVDYSRQTLKLDPNTKTKKVEELTEEEINNLSTGDLINYFNTTPSYEADQQETYTIDESENTLEPRVKVKEREEKIKPIDRIKIKQLETQRSSDGQLFKPGKYTPKNTIDADQNPKYRIKSFQKGLDGNFAKLPGSTMSPGYRLDIINGEEQWTYNGFPISPSEVNQEIYEGTMESAYPEEKEKMIDENNNGIPDFIERREYGPSPAQMRDDRIFNGAIKDGKVQQNMLKSGYKPR